jgi:hypothetical protein
MASQARRDKDMTIRCKNFNWNHIFCFLIISIALGGCMTKVGSLMPNDHFAYPNANVEPLGPVKSSMAKWTVLIPMIPTKETFEELRSDGLKQQGGDLLINGKVTTQMFKLANLVFYTELTMEGTAAKQTIGRQELH